MKLFNTQKELSNYLSAYKGKKTIGLVPTMGALHKGHQSLIEKAKEECEIVVASVFVNPTQFNEESDFEKYPRTIEDDSEKLKEVNCDILYNPSVEDIYENKNLETEPIDIGYLDTILEGEKRPGHYQGVVDVVERLMIAVGPDKIYMGLKDYQQVMVIEKLIKERKMDVTLVGCPTKREKSGLAMSSRNSRLSQEGKIRAAKIHECLKYITTESRSTTTPSKLITEAKKQHLDSDYFDTEYLEIRKADDLSEVNQNEWIENQKYVVLIATWLEGIRLIDNMTF